MHREGLQVAELRVWASWPSWKATGIKEATASLVETVTHLLDDVRGGGEFMMARVRKPA
jgi:hypothetical protein